MTRGERRAPDSVEQESKRAKRAVRAYGEDVKRRELREAVTKLEANGTLTDAQRTTVSQMVSAIVEATLAPTFDVLDESAAEDDVVETVVDLFDSDERHDGL